MTDRPDQIFATAATADQPDAVVGVVWWAAQVQGFALKVLDYEIAEMSAINADWINALFTRSAELAAEHRPIRSGCKVRVEHEGLKNILQRADDAFRETKASETINRTEFDISPIKSHEASKWPTTIDERADMIRPLVNSGRVVKLETGLRKFGFRAIRTNHLIAQIKKHRPGDSTSAGELFGAFLLGTLLGTTPRPMTFFEAVGRRIDREAAQKIPQPAPPSNPFGGYLPGRRPW